jgi:SAP domain
VSAERRQAPEGGWGELTVDELKSELEARGLTKSGKKDDLIARLEEDDAAAGAPAAAPIEEATVEAVEEGDRVQPVPESETPEPDSDEAPAAADADEEAAEEQPRRRRGSA